MRFSPGNAQHIGARSEQQDSFGFSDPSDQSLVTHGGIATVVADGMGGLAGGSAASKAAVQAFLSAYALKQPGETIPDALLRSIESANSAVSDLSRKSGEKDGLGTTLAAVVVHNDSLYWVSAGDSRVYFYRDGQVIQLTTDHNYAYDLELEVAQGRISKEHASQDPQRESLTSYLGLEKLPKVDRSLRPYPLKPGDCALICSDGLYRTLPEGEMAAMLRTDAHRTCEALMKRAVSKQNAKQDNITVVALQCESEDHPLIPPPPTLKVLVSAGALLFVFLGILFGLRGAAPKIADFHADNPKIVAGQKATLHWSVSGGSVRIDPEIGSVPQNVGSGTVSPYARTTYRLVAQSMLGSDERTLVVDVTPSPPPAPVISTFEANPQGVKKGQPTLLSWTIVGPVKTVLLNDKAVPGSSFQTDPLKQTTSYHLKVIGPGGTDSRSFEVPVSENPPPSISFTVTPTTIHAGDYAKVAWSVGKGATSIRIDPTLKGDKPKLNDARMIQPTANQTYKLTVKVDGDAEISKAITIKVLPARKPPAIKSFISDKSSVKPGESVTLKWTNEGDVESFAIDQGIGMVKGNAKAVTPSATTKYTLTATGPGGKDTKTIQVVVVNPKIDKFESEKLGDVWKLRWSVSGVDDETKITIDPDLGAHPATGEITVTPAAKTDYKLTVTGPGGSVSKTLTVDPAQTAEQK